MAGNNIASILYLAPLRFIQVFNAMNNKLSSISDVCDTIKGWYYLHEVSLAGNPICKKYRWKERIIASTKRLGIHPFHPSFKIYLGIFFKFLAILDQKDINDTTRLFIQRMEVEKSTQRHSNYIEQPGKWYFYIISKIF